MNAWKKHWCVLKDDTLMWFRGKQVLRFLQARLVGKVVTWTPSWQSLTNY